MLFRTKRSPWRMSGLRSYPLGWVTWRSNGSLLEDHFYLHKGKVVHFSKIKRVTFRLTNIILQWLLMQLRQRNRHQHFLIIFVGRKWSQVTDTLLVILDNHILIQHCLIGYDNIITTGHIIKHATLSCSLWVCYGLLCCHL